MLSMKELITHPRFSSEHPGDFLRLCLSLVAGHGVPSHIVAQLDDTAAVLGFYDPLPRPVAAHVAGPMVYWRTDPHQPLMTRFPELEALCAQQRAMIAFGLEDPRHLVGTAEIVLSMVNIIRGSCPPEYLDLFHWAALDANRALAALLVTPIPPPDETGWRDVRDEDVFDPRGRLHLTYQEVATNIRREAGRAIAANHPRDRMRQLMHLRHRLIRREMNVASAERLPGLERQLTAIEALFPDIFPAPKAPPPTDEMAMAAE